MISSQITMGLGGCSISFSSWSAAPSVRRRFSKISGGNAGNRGTLGNAWTRVRCLHQLTRRSQDRGQSVVKVLQRHHKLGPSVAIPGTPHAQRLRGKAASMLLCALDVPSRPPRRFAPKARLRRPVRTLLLFTRWSAASFRPQNDLRSGPGLTAAAPRSTLPESG